MTDLAKSRWYCINSEGLATLCADQNDAERVAADSDAAFPRFAPHAASRMVAIYNHAAERQQGAVPLPRHPIAPFCTWCPSELATIEAYGCAREAARRADAVPESWHQFVLECAKTGGSEVCGNQLSARAQELLQALHQNPPAEPAARAQMEAGDALRDAMERTIARSSPDTQAAIRGEPATVNQQLTAGGIPSARKWSADNSCAVTTEWMAGWDACRVEYPRASPSPAHAGDVSSLRALIADDAWAISFQSLGQYRTALLARCAAIKRDGGSGDADTERLEALLSNSWDLRCFDMPTPGGDDADIGWRVIEHHRAEPHERVVAEIYRDDMTPDEITEITRLAERVEELASTPDHSGMVAPEMTKRALNAQPFAPRQPVRVWQLFREGFDGSDHITIMESALISALAATQVAEGKT